MYSFVSDKDEPNYHLYEAIFESIQSATITNTLFNIHEYVLE